MKKTLNIQAVIVLALAALALVAGTFFCTKTVLGAEKGDATPLAVATVEPTVEATVEPTATATPSEEPVVVEAPKATSKASSSYNKQATLKAAYDEEPAIVVDQVVEVTDNTVIEDLTQATVEALEPEKLLPILEQPVDTDYEVSVAIAETKVEAAIETVQETRLENVQKSVTPDVGVVKVVAPKATSTAPISVKAETANETVVVREDKSVSVIEKAPSTTKTEVQVVDSKTADVKTEATVEKEGQVQAHVGDTVIVTETTTEDTTSHAIVVEEPVEVEPVVADIPVVDGIATFNF